MHLAVRLHAYFASNFCALTFKATFSMYNNNGSPAFRPKIAYTSSAGAYEIDTDTDFTSNMDFVVGMAGSDDAGRMRALASVRHLLCVHYSLLLLTRM